MIEVTLRGMEQLDRRLLDLEPKLSRSILRTAVRRAANVVRDAARAGAPKGKTGVLRRSIRTTLRRGKPGLTVASVSAGSSTAAQKRRGQDAFYARFVERGHKIVPRSKGGGRTSISSRRRLAEDRRRKLGGGFVEGRPFLLPALVAQRAEVERVMRDEISRRLGELGAI